jgi:hypothetical protein
MHETDRSNLNPVIIAIGEGEAWHRKYKGLELEGGQACDRSSECCFGIVKKFKA